jgi:superfamily I DNA/RNA helicase
VALICYSRGLAAYLTRLAASLPKRERPRYVGEFLGLGQMWGAAAPSGDDTDYWERRLPAEMLTLAGGLARAEKFDAVVVDEGQDFAANWWPVVTASLRDEESGGIYVFSDAGQRLFARGARPPFALTPLTLTENLRNTKQVAASFNPLAPRKMRFRGGDGPEVRLIACRADEALDIADDAIDELLDSGWRTSDVALLTTGSRHPEQAARQAVGQGAYWESFWDDEQVFYGHVLGFKGLERPAIVLAVNESVPNDRARERLYVGLSRARDELVVCGDPDYLRAVAGDAVLSHMRTNYSGRTTAQAS